MKGRWTIPVLLAILTVAGCGRPHPAVEVAGGYASSATAYGKLLPQYTREVQLYNGFDTVAKGVATWRADELQRAAVEASIERYQLQGAAAAQLRSKQQQAASTAREFHLALYTPQRQLNDLEAPGTLWRAFLELPNGERLEPLEVVFLKKTDKSSVEYPYVTPWTREYTLRFPRIGPEESPRHVTLVLAGAQGTLRFAF